MTDPSCDCRHVSLTWHSSGQDSGRFTRLQPKSIWTAPNLLQQAKNNLCRCVITTRCCLFVPKRRDVFFQLEEEARRTVLREPLQEITLMLEQNLLHKFRQKYGVHSLKLPPSSTGIGSTKTMGRREG